MKRELIVTADGQDRTVVVEGPLPGAGEGRFRVTVDGKEVGRLTSPVVSPTLGPIGLALVRREAPPGTTLDDGSAVVELPFPK